MEYPFRVHKSMQWPDETRPQGRTGLVPVSTSLLWKRNAMVRRPLTCPLPRALEPAALYLLHHHRNLLIAARTFFVLFFFLPLSVHAHCWPPSNRLRITGNLYGLYHMATPYTWKFVPYTWKFVPYTWKFIRAILLPGNLYGLYHITTSVYGLYVTGKLHQNGPNWHRPTRDTKDPHTQRNRWKMTAPGLHFVQNGNSQTCTKQDGCKFMNHDIRPTTSGSYWISVAIPPPSSKFQHCYIWSLTSLARWSPEWNSVGSKKFTTTWKFRWAVLRHITKLYTINKGQPLGLATY